MNFKVLFILICIIFLGGCAKNEQIYETDVLVIGGTTGGISAGIQSARMGVPTIIVEETPWLGGMITAQGVSATDGNHNLHSGIWNEFRNKLQTHYGSEAALATGWVSNTQFEPWFGTKGGISVFNGTEWTSYSANEGLLSNNVLCIVADNNGVVWIGTDNGVSGFDNGTFTNYK